MTWISKSAESAESTTVDERVSNSTGFCIQSSPYGIVTPVSSSSVNTRTIHTRTSAECVPKKTTKHWRRVNSQSFRRRWVTVALHFVAFRWISLQFVAVCCCRLSHFSRVSSDCLKGFGRPLAAMTGGQGNKIDNKQGFELGIERTTRAFEL